MGEIKDKEAGAEVLCTSLSTAPATAGMATMASKHREERASKSLSRELVSERRPCQREGR